LLLCTLTVMTVVVPTRAQAPPVAAPAAPTHPASAFVEPGVLPDRWNVSGPKCMEMPAWQVHEYNPNFFILRQSGCIHYEKPFLYLIFGKDKALLEDTGAGQIETAPFVMDLVAKWGKRNDKTGPVPLIVVHSHAHGDHTAGDTTFSGQPNTTVVPKSLAGIQAQFSISPWPSDEGMIDLGGRVLDVLAIPGHETQHIAIYDRKTGLLLTGDTLYPGLLFINDWATYRTSVKRLAQFAGAHPIAYVLGAHIEMTATPKQVYPYGTTYQPNEHVLQLSAAHVTELDAALTQLGATPPAQPVAHDDFVIDPQ
jgi:glyoxylase-like metal-dependent hydrolase (beta-lactamase superfamily II)